MLISTPDTYAIGGPSRHQSSIASTAAASPSNSASTAPSQRLLTQPVRPSEAAWRWQLARKPTPCTRPVMTTWTRFCAIGYLAA